jgi:hypothetical protein
MKSILALIPIVYLAIASPCLAQDSQQSVDRNQVESIKKINDRLNRIYAIYRVDKPVLPRQFSITLGLYVDEDGGLSKSGLKLISSSGSSTIDCAVLDILSLASEARLPLGRFIFRGPVLFSLTLEEKTVRASITHSVETAGDAAMQCAILNSLIEIIRLARKNTELLVSAALTNGIHFETHDTRVAASVRLPRDTAAGVLWFWLNRTTGLEFIRSPKDNVNWTDPPPPQELRQRRLESCSGKMSGQLRS